MTCEDVNGNDIIGQYVHRRLSDADRDAFEQHFLGCDACFAGVQDYRLLRQELQSTPIVAAVQGRTSMGLTVRAWSAIGVAAAIALAVVATMLSRTVPPPPTIASTPAPASPSGSKPVAPAPSRTELVAQLARFEPPNYQPSRLRDADTDQVRTFQAAMRRYQERDYAGAAEALRKIVAAQPTAADALFYLGVCELHEGQIGAARATLAKVIAASEAIYEEDAWYLSAKAALVQGDVVAARAALQKVVVLDGDRAREARKLVAAIDALPPS
jgi:hypothetical protein